MVKMIVEWKGFAGWVRAENKWQEKVRTQTNREVKRTALQVERDAKKMTPVDTGKLRGSIETDIKTVANATRAEVGTDVEYSEVVEFGGRYQRAQPYLIPSFDRNAGELERTLNKLLRG